MMKLEAYKVSIPSTTSTWENANNCLRHVMVHDEFDNLLAFPYELLYPLTTIV
jgi:hypothetical protein